MQWNINHWIIAADKMRIKVSTIPDSIVREIDLAGLSKEEREKKFNKTVEELKKEFIVTVKTLITPIEEVPKKPSEDESKAPIVPPITESPEEETEEVKTPESTSNP